MTFIKKGSIVISAIIFLVLFRWITIMIGCVTFRNVVSFRLSDTMMFHKWMRLSYEVLLELGFVLLLLMVYDILKYFTGFNKNALLILLAAPFIFYVSTLIFDMSCVKPLLSINRLLIYTLIKLPFMVLCLWLYLQRRIKINKGHVVSLILITIGFTLFKLTGIILV